VAPPSRRPGTTGLAGPDHRAAAVTEPGPDDGRSMDRATARALSDAETAHATPAFSPAIAPDRLVIRYLDGSTTNSPRGAGLRLLERESVSTTRLLAALSTALDLTEGQLPGHALRTAFLAMGVADGMRMSEADRATLFYAAFLKDAGCSSNAAAISRLFGADDIMDVGVAANEKGEMTFRQNPPASFLKEGGMIQLRVLPIDCNDKAGTTLVSFADMNLPPGVPAHLFNQIPFIQNARLKKR